MSDLKKGFGKLCTVFGQLLDLCGILTAAVLFLLLAYQIIIRIFFQRGDSAANEMVTYCFIWLIYIGMAVAAKDSGHIKVTMLSDALPPKGKYLVEISSHLLWLYYNFYIIWASLQLIQKVKMLNSASPIMNIPMYVLYAVLPVTHLVASIYVIRDIIKFARLLCGKGGPGVTEQADTLDRSR